MPRKGQREWLAVKLEPSSGIRQIARWRLWWGRQPAESSPWEPHRGLHRRQLCLVWVEEHQRRSGLLCRSTSFLDYLPAELCDTVNGRGWADVNARGPHSTSLCQISSQHGAVRAPWRPDVFWLHSWDQHCVRYDWKLAHQTFEDSCPRPTWGCW